MTRFWAASTFLLFSLDIASAASSKIPDKNPFRGPEVSELAKKIKDSPAIKIYFSGNIGGMKESCGCAINPKGGFERRYNFLKKEGVYTSQKDDAILLDFGNLLFKSSNIKHADQKEAFANALEMIKGTSAFKYAAVNFGQFDRSLDEKQLEKLCSESRFPWLSSNITPPDHFKAHFNKQIPMKFKNGEVEIFGLSSMDDKLMWLGWHFEKPAVVLTSMLKDLPMSVLPIVLSDLETAELMPIAESMKRPIVFLGARETGGWDRPIQVGQALLVHLRPQGQDWGVLKLVLNSENGKAWFNPSDADTLAQRWDDLSTEAQTVRALASAGPADIKDLEAKLTELYKYAPIAGDIPYNFEAVEMGQGFEGSNEVSKYMK